MTAAVVMENVNWDPGKLIEEKKRCWSPLTPYDWEHRRGCFHEFHARHDRAAHRDKGQRCLRSGEGDFDEVDCCGVSISSLFPCKRGELLEQVTEHNPISD